MVRLKEDQNGIAAIMVSMLLVIVIGLLVFSFSQISIRNQHEALVNALSTQATDAAQSGINQFNNFISTNTSYTSPSNQNCSTMNGVSSGGKTINYTISTVNNVYITCLITNTTPPYVTVSNLNPSASGIYPLIDAAHNNINQLVFSWTEDTGSGYGTGCSTYTLGQFPSYDNYTNSATGCDYPILRVDIVKPPATITSNTLLSNTVTIFMQPFLRPPKANTTPSFGGGSGINTNQADLVNCSVNTGSSTCKSYINLSGSDTYYVRVTPLYEALGTLTISGSDSAGTVDFTGAQATVDSTAKAQNVVSRVFGVINLGDADNGINVNGSIFPGNAIESTNSICKNMDVIVTPPPEAVTGGNC